MDAMKKRFITLAKTVGFLAMCGGAAALVTNFAATYLRSPMPLGIIFAVTAILTGAVFWAFTGKGVFDLMD